MFWCMVIAEWRSKYGENNEDYGYVVGATWIYN